MTENPIRLSFVIPHYNSPGSLQRLLDSIPAREDVQIIVVDDNSTKELEAYREVVEANSPRVTFLRNTTGIQSAGACRNIGIDAAAGEWILFADADDYYLPGMYETIRPYLASDYDMVIFCPVSVNVDTGKPGTRHYKHEVRIRRYLQDPTRKNYLSLCRTTTIWSKLIRRRVLEENGIYCNTSLHGNDFVCSQKLFYYCKKKHVSAEKIYCVTETGGSLTTKKSVESFENSVKQRTEGNLFNRAHYSPKDLRYIDLAGAESILSAVKKGMPKKEILWGIRYFRSNGVNILPYRLRDPRELVRYLRSRQLI